MDFDSVQQSLGIEFENLDYLHEALTHPSCLKEHGLGFHRSNEALAWLGDALIHWVISKSIYNPTSKKGDLTEDRKLYVKKKALSDSAKKLGLNKELIIPEHRVKVGGRRNQKNLHTVYEAVVGAIYRDRDYEHAKAFILRTCV